MAINVIKERKRLENIKDQLEQLKEKQREAEAEKKHLMKKLNDDYKCKTLEDAEKLLEELEEDIETLEKDITKRTEKMINDMKREGFME